MENATKALLIAGGVLIAIIIISLFVMMYGKVTNMQKAQEQKTEMEQLLAFNAEYEAYDKKVMYGADVITLVNKIKENNTNYQGNDEYQIELYLNNVKIEDSSELLADSDFKTTLFKCKLMSYNESGRISKIEILSFR